jgi:hypothetical protein
MDHNALHNDDDVYIHLHDIYEFHNKLVYDDVHIHQYNIYEFHSKREVRDCVYNYLGDIREFHNIRVGDTRCDGDDRRDDGVLENNLNEYYHGDVCDTFQHYNHISDNNHDEQIHDDFRVDVHVHNVHNAYHQYQKPLV